ncbi:hypothetical protein K504DRAFT_534826 [Pleomassaria siparia CBS 279.74]|uniref:Uncharacterized protein n=1 Tax=Pleomassaria siparia CBS 279.74 TaxID=1314801 RepID=A0A6G1K5N0_9PLEO|nr:hypothetical protein K504DRAFT_534826 [Pleomassaria siparia CBS 279.74]
MDTQTRVISNSSLRFLYEAGNPITIKAGFRTVSMQTISSYSSDETIDVPDILNSVESLQFCGMSTETSNMLFQKWTLDQETLVPGNLGHGEEIISLAKYYVKQMSRKYNAYLENDDWNYALRKQGISETTIGRIMDPKFQYLRLSSSASEWALDTLSLSWEFLDGLDARVKRSKKELVMRSTSPDPSLIPMPAIKPSSSLSSALHGGSSSLLLASEAEPPKQMPGKSMFYKGGGWDRLISIFNPDGSLNLSEIVSDPPTDFHPFFFNLYFTKQYDVAEHYAEYAGRRVPAQTPTIMTVAVPQAIMAQSREIFGADWRNLIWHSRNKTVLVEAGGRLPSQLSEYEEAQVLIGNICYQGTDQIKRLKSSDELLVLRTKRGDKGSQIMLHGMEMLDLFKKECRGLVWVAPVATPEKAKFFPSAP